VSSGPIANAVVKVLPDTTAFQATLQREVTRAIGALKVPPVVVPVVVGGGKSAAATTAAASATASLGPAGKKAAAGMAAANTEANALRGLAIGISRVTPVTVFGLGLLGTVGIAVGLAIKEALPATSALDAANAMTELVKAGISVNDTLAASRGVLQLSAAANIEAGQAATIVASQLNAYGLAGERATSITDLLAGASIAAQGEIGDFANAFQQSASAAKTAGISVETTTGLLTELAKAGIRSSDAGTSLRTTILRLVPTTKQAAEFQAKLGIELDRNATIGAQLPNLIEQYRVALLKLPPADKVEALNQIFGQDAFRAASIIFSQNRGELERITAEVSKTGSGARLAEARMKGLAGATEGLRSSAQTLGTTLGTSLLPLLTSTVTTLSNITTAATDAAGGLQKLGDVTIKPVVGLVGGSDVVAQVALAAGIGLGTKALIARRAAHKAEQAAVAAAKASVVAAETAVAEAAVVSAEVQVKATSGITAAMERQLLIQRAIAGTYALEGIAAERSAATVIAATGKKVAGVLSANTALSAGLALSVAGGIAPGAAGSILGAAGAGAIAGSFIPLPGAPVIGAVALGAIAALRAAQTQNAKDKAAVKSQWQSLTFEEQQTFLRQYFPRLAKDNAGRDELEILLASTAKDSAKGGGKLAVGKGQTAEAFVKAQGGFSLPEPDEILKAFIATQTLVIPPLDQISAKDNIGQAIKTFFSKRASILPGAKAEVLLTKKAQLDLNVALAQLSGSTVEVGKALEAQAAFELQWIAHLQKQLANATPAGFVIKDVKARDAKAKEITDAIAAYKATMAQLAQEASETFEIPTDITIAGIRASVTPGLGDNLTTAQSQATAAHKLVTQAEAALKAGKTTQEIVDGLRVQAAQADAAVVTAQKAISDDAVSSAKKAADVQVGNARRLADAAGNQGKAERTLLAILKKRVADAKANSQELLDARNALDEELKNQQRALVERTKLQIDLQNSVLSTRLLKAQATPQIDDNIKVLNLQIKAAERDRKASQKIADDTTKAAKIRLEAALQVQEDERTIFNLKQDIKNLRGQGAGGFTLRELFQEAADEFTKFGSNIATPGGILSGQDARASFAQTILSNLPKAIRAAIPKTEIGGVVKQGEGFRPARESGGITSPGQVDPVLPVVSAQLSQAEQQTAYLAQIAAAVSHGGPGKGKIPAPVTGNRGRVGSLEAIDAVQAASIWGYS
jgi:TP901 family phage tail tape measure protein